MNPRQFLLIGGILLTLAGILGMIGVIGPTAEDSIFGSKWWFGDNENWTHLVIGLIILIASFSLPDTLQRSLAMVIGGLSALVGVYNFFSTNFLGSHLETPADLIFHLVVGAWAFYSAKSKTRAAPTMNMPPM